MLIPCNGFVTTLYVRSPSVTIRAKKIRFFSEVEVCKYSMIRHTLLNVEC
jgi:hypothetical protein